MKGDPNYLVTAVSGPEIHGEGSLVGVVAAVIRFSGCNMWSGKEDERAGSACPFCDVEFAGGLRITRRRIVSRIKSMLPRGGWVIVTGGEPLLQLDRELAVALRLDGFSLAVETNGTVVDPTVRFEAELVDDRAVMSAESRIDHITLSPKVPRDEVKLERCDDLKILHPHPNPAISPEVFASYPARRRFLQPITVGDEELDAAALEATRAKLIELNRDGPHRWRLSTRSAA